MKDTMKKFIVIINAYEYYSKFEVLSQDNPESLEEAIVDKLGKNDIVWEYTGENSRRYRITYEEVININDATTSERSIQAEKSIGSTMGTGAS
jgi:hypothetical protein